MSEGVGRRGVGEVCGRVGQKKVRGWWRVRVEGWWVKWRVTAGWVHSGIRAERSEARKGVCGGGRIGHGGIEHQW